ncbi:MAG: cupin [Candidatus Ryanbacteria bacterium RIFCSPHIGHO2_02_FULL_45_43]|uniref:Cupin n=1 Tax=Candidatus Ryanbacteria bacterium RIFCSPHIGHO2_01_45_13 TaxID=1802112 RepID=A0A1G2FTC7_9BACT|nr:MAG: cupin [Candidatus Ryanbacteria bacterium RIFCSPHIGHO2_01_45_13]OGZ41504.1 MAG: cupin [Candidatus Ryanbacteria bacterium RIFCSPHIGHO2_01_FULL_44_130]OGZ47971.1 MAG: cupin [Candidatus Ryanbacteria bacterium RIFCSPHIGHO2_02_FULL_45_43]OGZ50107.1 MAG: cupin [Candidatus Ryanbacteria bacterium RIFCSPHIGHO2_12_FULL_44_20]OGZ51109.1 MAG: cupin [Candidatus Ryanbacteria bacterium RIFCSPLOWO2_01_FULL_44_230]OGZ54396.1 MAG: cupin [Candidatus Ryanbacteria bacterium RIFCSPLOWO2_02_FULL_44_40]OGZ552
MKGYITNIEEKTLKNTDYRRVLYTAKNSQLVLMNIRPGDEIGNEMHKLDQFIRIERGDAKAILNNSEEYELHDDYAIIIPAGTWHNIINTGNKELKLYTVYSPPEHKDGTIHTTKAEEKEEHFNGQTTEQ